MKTFDFLVQGGATLLYWLWAFLKEGSRGLDSLWLGVWMLIYLAFIGIWQTASGLVWISTTPWTRLSRGRRRYFRLYLPALGTMITLAWASEWINGLVLFNLFGVVGLSMAVWYFILTVQAWKHTQTRER